MGFMLGLASGLGCNGIKTQVALGAVWTGLVYSLVLETSTGLAH